jgi:anti-sigma regulatory factor (Ser/Thr protein kinase)
VSELAPHLTESQLIDLRLLITEVVTNAVRHGRSDEAGRIELVVEDCPDGLRVEVRDGGAGFVAPAHPVPRESGAGGWGLVLVQRLARRWGAEPAPGAYVWFVLGAR